MALFLVACASHSDDEVTAERCAELRDHVVDLRIGEATKGRVGGISSAEIASHRAALSNALGEQFVQSCVRDYTAQQLRCALAADETAAAVTCAKTKETK